MGEERRWTIPQVMKELGITRDVLRGWIDRGRFPKPDHGGRHTFSDEDVERLRAVVRYTRVGYTPEKALEIAGGAFTPLDLIGSDRIQELMAVTSELAGGVIFDSRTAFLERIASAGFRLLDAESCSVFEVGKDDAGNAVLKLAAQMTDAGLIQCPEDARPVTLSIHHEAGRGLTGWIASEGRAVRLHGPALSDHPAVAGRTLNHLPSKRCISLMMIPIRDHRGAITAWLRADNRKVDGRIDGGFFDQADEWVGVQLGRPIPAALARARLVEAPEKLLCQKLPRAISLPEYLQEMLEQAVNISNADYGDVFWLDEERREMVLVAVYPPGGNKLSLNERLPRPSICHEVRRTGEYVNATDVEKLASVYYPGRTDVRSQLAVPLFRGRWQESDLLGVLSVEAKRENAFDDADVQALKYLGKYAGPATDTMELRSAFPRTVLDQIRMLTAEQSLSAILDGVARDLRLDEGLIYIADPKYGLLRCAASRPFRASALTFSYRFEATAFASIVFRTGEALFSPTPWEDPRVSKDGLALFGIHSPMVGVPLRFGSLICGSMIVWSKARIPTADDTTNLLPYAELAVTTGGQAEVLRRAADLDKCLGEAQESIHRGDADLMVVIGSILRGLAASFFDRARLFEYLPAEERFVCLDSYGEDVPGKFRGESVRPATNPYAHELLEKMTKGQMEAYEVDPKRHSFGEDPQSDLFLKKRGLPWCLVGMVIEGQPVGYIAADSFRRRIPVGQTALESMAKAARIGAQAVRLLRVKRARHSALTE